MSELFSVVKLMVVVVVKVVVMAMRAVTIGGSVDDYHDTSA